MYRLTTGRLGVQLCRIESIHRALLTPAKVSRVSVAHMSDYGSGSQEDSTSWRGNGRGRGGSYRGGGRGGRGGYDGGEGRGRGGFQGGGRGRGRGRGDYEGGGGRNQDREFQDGYSRGGGEYQNGFGRGGSGYQDGGSRGGYQGGGGRGGYDGGSRGGYDGGSRGGYDGGSRGGYDGGSRGGYDGGSRGGYDGGSRGGYDGGSRGGYRGSDNRFDSGSRGGYQDSRGGGGYRDGNSRVGGGKGGYQDTGRGGGGYNGRGGDGYQGGGGRDGFRGSGGRGRGGFNRGGQRDNFSALDPYSVRSESEFTEILGRLDGQGYGSYKQLVGTYQFTHPEENLDYNLMVENVQGDSYAPPSRFRVFLSIEAAGIPKETFDNPIKKIALCDYITRQAQSVISQSQLDVGNQDSGWSGSKGGRFGINYPLQQVIERTSCVIREADKAQGPILELRFTLGLPAAGRSILGEQASDLLTQAVPSLVQKGLLYKSFNNQEVQDHIRSVEVQEALRSSLQGLGLVGFVGNGSILPRKSGASALPMSKKAAVKFESPNSLEVSIDTGITDKNGAGIVVKGMGIPSGVTVITGGGFHGKSTLLNALELGVYNVVPGDGRELVVADPHAFKIRAEDGRSVVRTDISPFITNLPGPVGANTDSFTTADASGSTSMAANIQEAIEAGATTLLIDEDTSATNFLVRDKRMQELIKSEPIEPFVSKARALYDEHGVSTIIIIGGCGDYLTIADTVIGMEAYQAQDITPLAQSIVERFPVPVLQSSYYTTSSPSPPRIPVLPEFTSQPTARHMHQISVSKGETESDIDLTSLEQLVETGQTTHCAAVLRYIAQSKQRFSVADWKSTLKQLFDEAGLDAVVGADGWRSGSLVRARELEILAVVNRVRQLAIENDATGGGGSTGSTDAVET